MANAFKKFNPFKAFITLMLCCAFSSFISFIPEKVFALDTKTKDTKINTNVEAVSLPDELLYEARIPAPAPVDGPDDHTKLIQEAFKNMLVHASGSEKILTHTTVVKALTEVDNYVEQFGFQMNANQERVLRVRFDEGLCRALLKNAGQKVLSEAKRPPVVLWLTMQQDNAIQWVSRETQNELSHQLEALADKRGLTLVYPLLDLTDTALISEQQVWAEDLNALQAASKRYNADNILIGKLSKQPSGWYAQWTYVKQGSSVRWDMSNQELSAVFGEALDEFSNRLSSEPALVRTETQKGKSVANIASQKNTGNKDAVNMTAQEALQGTQPEIANGSGSSLDITANAIAGAESTTDSNSSNAGSSSGQNNTLRLSVVGVSGGEQYAKVLKYLQSLPDVKSVEVAEISPEQTIFKLDTKASPEVLMTAIAAGELLIENMGVSKELLQYKLVGAAGPLDSEPAKAEIQMQTQSQAQTNAQVEVQPNVQEAIPTVGH